jgi:hypothetical protein
MAEVVGSSPEKPGRGESYRDYWAFREREGTSTARRLKEEKGRPGENASLVLRDS